MTLLKSLAVAGLAATLSAGAARAEDWRLLREETALSAFAYGRDGALLQGSDIPEEVTPISEEDGTEGLRQALCDGRPPAGERYPSIDAFRASVAGS
jgi:hypothetical protein